MLSSCSEDRLPSAKCTAKKALSSWTSQRKAPSIRALKALGCDIYSWRASMYVSIAA